MEGSPTYSAYRDNLLREAERDYYYALSVFRRAHDALIASAAFWGHVGLYYSSWYAAHCIVAALGGWVDSRWIVEVVRETPGSQEFQVIQNPDVRRGSHRTFWSVYYNAMNPYRLLLDPKFILAIDPVGANQAWQIDTRNRLNYSVVEMQKLTDAFAATFEAATFPSSLPGETSTQYSVTRSMIHLAAHLLQDLGTVTDAYASRAVALKVEIVDAALPALFTSADETSFVV